MIKATAGGGGRGLVRDDSELVRLFQQPKARLKPHLGIRPLSGEIYRTPRHIEFQIMAIATATSSTWVSETAQSSVVTRS